MRAFFNAYGQLNLKNGAGKSPHIAADQGWSTDYTLPTAANDAIAQLKCDGGTWSDAAETNNDLPINCVPFNLAYAFCVWDGGRLPTEAEWNFAATGGNEQRAYPWKAPPVGEAITPAYANYDNNNPGPIAVGSLNQGNGRWGQADLAGNVSEWTLDYSADYPDSCIDCMTATPAADRTMRGGSYASLPDFLWVSFRFSGEPAQILPEVVFRCARDLD
jgi:formylglycine-generating enzyme required for sulfatase activity